MASEQRVSERLRQEIRELHDSIEATGSARRMIDGQIRSDEYVRLLRQMAGLHRAVEPRLAKALPAELFLAEMRRVEAIERDFTPAQRRVGELTAIPANALSEISSTHMKGSYMYANELANALAGANRDGEEARREERLRIWGYA